MDPLKGVEAATIEFCRSALVTDPPGQGTP
jgi:hypothetical protein